MAKGNIKILEASWNDAKGWIESCRQNFLQPIYPLLEMENYEIAKRKTTSLVNFCDYYIKKADKDKEIINLKKKMNGLKSDDYFKAKEENDEEKIKKIKSDSIQAIYDILVLINNILANFNMFVIVSKKKGFMEGIGSDD